MSNYDFDLFVIGAGSGGVRASRMAAKFGVRVAVAEEWHLGGTCVNIGCVPKKLMVYASHYGEDFHDSRGYGWNINGDVSFNWKTMIDNKDTEIQRLNGIYGTMLENSGVTLMRGTATITGKNTVQVGDTEYTAERILVAVGGWPVIPDVEGKQYISNSNDVFTLQDCPKRVLVLGSGYIAVEFAGIFNGLGSDVILAHRKPKILGNFDTETTDFLYEQMQAKGIDLRASTQVQKVAKVDSGYKVTLNTGDVVEVDFILAAIGRNPKTDGLGLDTVGVATENNGAIIVNDDFQTSVPSIYALGDVINRVQLTPVALGEAMVWVHNMYNNENREMSYDNIPTAIFSQPNVGTVGLSENEALDKYGKLRIYTSSYRAMKNTLSGNEERSFMKIIVDDSSDRVVGMHMVGPDAGEIMQGFGVALKCGATKSQLDSTIGIHPTAAEELVTMRDVTRVVEK